MSPSEEFRGAFRRHLRRRRRNLLLEGGRRGGRRALLAAAVLLGATVLGLLPPPGGPAASLALYGALLLAGSAAGAALALRAGGSEGALASALDGVLGRADLVATAAALARRPAGSGGRFAAAVVERAAEAVAALPPEAAADRPRPPWRLLGLAALVALLVALLPQGGFGLLPGFGSGWGTGGRPRTEGGNWGTPGEKEGGRPREDPGAAPGPRPGPAEAPGAEPEPGEAPPRPEPVAELSMGALAKSTVHGFPVNVSVRTTGLAGAGEGVDLELFVAVDGGEPAGEGTRRRVAEGAADGRAVDLRSFAPLLPRLGPGKHRVAGEVRDAGGAVVARAPEFEVTVEGEPGGGGGGAKEPEPKPRPEPREEPEPVPPPPAGVPPPPGAGPRPEPPPEPRLPPSRLEEKVVRPLFGEGPEAVKKGPILVLDPEGSRGDAPRPLEPEEALAEVRARAETAARREGIDPRDAEAVRRYFEALRRLLEPGR